MLLAGACDRGTSGTFTFRHGPRRDVLTLRGGKIAVVRTSDPVVYLGGVLYELGSIDAATLTSTLHEVAVRKRLHGEVLVETSAITRERLPNRGLNLDLAKVSGAASLSRRPSVWHIDCTSQANLCPQSARPEGEQPLGRRTIRAGDVLPAEQKPECCSTPTFSFSASCRRRC